MKLLSLLALGSALPFGVFGWGAAGHEIVATIAQIHLHPTVLPTICEILNFTSTNPNEPQCHLAPIAAWADKLKYRMRWSAAMHYVGALDDHPSQTCAFPGTRGWAGRKDINVLGAIQNTTGILEGYMKGERNINAANEALKFLVHFLGDLHMPLHLTGRDRGGNSVKVLFDGRQTSLHSLWDGLLIAKNLRTIPYNYSRPLPIRQVEYNLRGAIYDPFVRRVMWEGIYGSWKDEMSDWLSCPQTPSSDLPGQFSQSSFSFPWNSFSTLWTSIRSLIYHTGVQQTTDDNVICPQYWAQPTHKLNCELIWPKALDEPPYGGHTRPSERFVTEHDHHHYSSVEAELAQFDLNGRFIGGDGDDMETTGRRGHGGGASPYLEMDTPEYTGVIAERRILEKLMAQAGIRLAGILNMLFVGEDDGKGFLSVMMDT
ncbi:hypothetical protein E1B28_002529 [Marasmius oreades]|uniref:Phospholipase C/P1 nuclease n=1 Tax=Marasmius oreades TaxID=181124 RepID=A0A9P7ULI9_9AGAR|nr:uncharacterized protein E1B28_002529 [Marasmius oreades]KAG7086583.1 hypothetical protein E1B28_002529 [Marasmius oreades]